MTDPYRAAARDSSDRLWMPPTGCLWIPALLTAALLIPGCLPTKPEPVYVEHVPSWTDHHPGPQAQEPLESWPTQGGGL